MIGTITPPGEPVRRGLPVDPVLQLYAGDLRALPSVASPGGAWVPLVGANPARVCLYVQTLPALFYVSPDPDPTLLDVTRAPSIPGVPLALHCRDFPGLVQGEWSVLTVAGQTVQVWEYTLQPWW